MSFAERMVNEVDAHLDNLQAEFGAFEVRERTFQVTRELLADAMSVEAKHALGGARALVEHDDRTLLVKDDPGTPWDAPGSDRDPGEAYAATAQRAVRDAAGLECDVTGVHFVLRYEFTLVEGTTGATGLWVLFAAETTDATVEVSDDVTNATWFSVPPDDLAGDVRECVEPGGSQSH